MNKIAIGIPTAGTIKTKTVSSLIGLIKKIPCEWHLLTQIDCFISASREDIVKKAMEIESTHLLFIDSDMVFENNSLERLIQRDKDIIGANCNMKKIPLEPVIKRKDPDGQEIWREYSDGLIECCAVGMAFTLIKLSIFKNIPHPWFFLQPNNDGSLKYGEDMWFCRKAREAGYKIWCDSTIKIKHIGDYEY